MNKHIKTINGRDVIIQSCCKETDGDIYANVGISNGQESIFDRRLKARQVTFHADGTIIYPYLCDEKSHDTNDITPEAYEEFLSENHDDILEFVKGLL